MRFKIALDEAFQFRIAKAADQISKANLKAAQESMRDLAVMTYSKAQEMASQRLNTTRQRYIDALTFQQVSNNHWAIKLDADAAHLEEGYSGFSMIERGLTRGPASWLGKSGYRYVHVPFEHKSAFAGPQHPMNPVPVQRGQISETTKGNLANDLNLLKRAFGFGGVVLGFTGNPLQGRVGRVSKASGSDDWTYADVMGNVKTMNLSDRNIHPNLVGLTQIQYKQPLRRGGFRARTAYMTWRTATDNPNRKAAWYHPGHDGARIYPDLERWAIDQLNTRLREIFGP